MGTDGSAEGRRESVTGQVRWDKECGQGDGNRRMDRSFPKTIERVSSDPVP